MGRPYVIKTTENNMKKLQLMLMLLVILSACSSVATPAPETKPEASPSIEVTAAPALKYHPLDTMTQIEEIDLVLYAIASGDVQELRNLFGFTTLACKTVNALGGPPECREGEAEGTLVEVLPSQSGEGSYLRKVEVGKFPGLDVIGVYAIYQVSETAYSEENFPKGDYAIMLIAPENRPGVVLQIKNGQIVRIDYVFDPQSFDMILQRDASTFVLSPISK